MKTGTRGMRPSSKKLVEMKEQFLRALHRERRDHERAAGVNRILYRALQQLLSLADVLVHAVAVGRFDQAIIRGRQCFGRLDDRRRRIAEVAGKNDRLPFGLTLMNAEPKICPAS